MRFRPMPARIAIAVALMVAGSIPASAQVYYYSRGWRDPVYAPLPPAPLPSPRYVTEIPPWDIEAMLRARGFMQISRPQRMGQVYAVHVTDRNARRMALVVDRLSGEIVDRQVLGVVIDRGTRSAAIAPGESAPDRRPAVVQPPPAASLSPSEVPPTVIAPPQESAVPATRAPAVAAKPPAMMQEESKPPAASAPIAPSLSGESKPLAAKPAEAKPAAASPAAAPAVKPPVAAKPAPAANPTAAAKALGKQEERPVWAQRRSPQASATAPAPARPAPPVAAAPVVPAAPSKASTAAFPPVQGLD